ncbi:PEP-CTERM sorting domain-containing protein [Tamilnaduibacter salinus]|nr:PEP-CTERM sorting domain-containing protein [Tamilnaduibacter salinus]
MMFSNAKRAIAGLFLTLGIAQSATAGLILKVVPETTTVQTGESFQVDLWASIPDAEPVLAWGLDLEMNAQLLGLNNVLVDSTWLPLGGPGDGDGLGGAALPPQTGEARLATLSFSALNAGSAEIGLSHTLTDFSEGFALAAGGFADYEVASAEVEIADVAEPGTLGLLAVSLLGLGLARRSKGDELH